MYTYLHFYIFVNYTDLLTTDFPRGCTNCEARISNFCCSTAWNGICCEFPLKKKQVSNKHSQNSTKQQKFHFTIANQSGPRLRWQMKICDDSWLVSDRTQILGIPTYPSRVWNLGFLPPKLNFKLLHTPSLQKRSYTIFWSKKKKKRGPTN